MAKCRDKKLLKKTDSAIGLYPIKVRVYIDRAEGFGKIETEYPSGIMFTYNNLPIMAANDHVEFTVTKAGEYSEKDVFYADNKKTYLR